MKWRLAKSLEKLREQINEAHPDRNRDSDGSIGDERHQKAGTSDHLPNAQGVVTAVDVTHDPRHLVNCNLLAAQLIKDVRVKYVIWNHFIWKARTGAWEPYRGANPHNKHIHVSVLADASKYDNDAPWTLESDPQANVAQPTARRVLKFDMKGPDVEAIQRRLGLTKIDGHFGRHTLAAVLEWQKYIGLEADGIVGAKTWASLFPNEK